MKNFLQHKDNISLLGRSSIRLASNVVPVLRVCVYEVKGLTPP